LSNLAGTVNAHEAEKPRPTTKQLNLYHLGLEQLIARVERSSSHYEALGVEPSATHEEIRLAYLHSLTLLYPPYAVANTLHSEMVPRIEKAFSKISWAFSVLASRPKRTGYERILAAKLEADEKAAKTASAAPVKRVAKQPLSSAADQAISTRSSNTPRTVYAENAKAISSNNRRRADRLKVHLPVRVSGNDRESGKWSEMSKTIDISRTGVTIQMKKLVKHGTVLYVTLPFPSKLRAHGYSEPSYNVYSLVRRVGTAKNGVRVVALEFLGEHPPVGYLDKPWAIFRTKTWAGSERRRAKRKDQSEVVMLEYITGDMQVLAREKARTENVSSSGARILVSNPPAEFDLVRVTSSKLKFDSLATVSNRYFGMDSFERLCVQFINREWPM
jgi:hypothetical protein